MADIRINALATTATTPASDDFLALDGTAQGTRKILATNIANNVTDVVFGTSGPSAKSSIAARAARQGLVFDGTAGTTWAGFTPSSSDFTVAAWFSATSLAANNVIIDGTGGSSGFAFYVATDGSIRRLNRNAGTTETTAAGLVVTGKRYHIAYVRGAFYLNGVSVLTFTDTQNYNAALTRIGWSAGSDSFCTGFLSVIIYNRALTAAEVVSLYEAGVPSGADYNTASNTAIYSTDFSSATGWTLGDTGTYYTISGGVATVAISGDSGGATALKRSLTPNSAKSYRVTYTIAGVTSGSIRFQLGGTNGTLRSTNGTYTEDIVTSAAGSSIFYFLQTLNVGATIDNLAIYATGLLLAPDAAQAGGGLTWYDTSGNAANITLPASGVTWNVPSSLKVGGNWTFGGDLTVSGTGQSSLSSSSALFAVGTSAPTSTNTVGVPQIVAESDLYSSVASIAHNTTDGNYGFFLTGKSRGTKASPLIVADGDRVGGYGFIAYDGAAYRTSAEIVGVIDGTPGAADLPTRLSFRVAADGSASPSEQMRLTSGGNLLLKSDGVDSGNGKLQLATHTTSAGGIGFGTDVSLYRYTAGRLGLAHIGGGTPTLYLLEGTTETARLWTANGPCYLDTLTAQPIYFRPNGTTALTLDNSQNATFAGNVYIQSGNALRLYNPTNAAFASIQMDANNVVNVNYTTAFGVTIRTQGGTASTPASASAAGVAGTIQWDASYIYVCTAANTWKRVAIATW